LTFENKFGSAICIYFFSQMVKSGFDLKKKKLDV